MIWFIWIIIAIASLLAVAIGRRYGAPYHLRKREDFSKDQIFTEIKQKNLNYEIYSEVVGWLAIIGKIRAQQIHPADRLDNIFSADSWEMGKNQEMFEDWLKKNGMNARDFVGIETVSDLVFVVQNHASDHVVPDGQR